MLGIPCVMLVDVGQCGPKGIFLCRYSRLGSKNLLKGGEYIRRHGR